MQLPINISDIRAWITFTTAILFITNEFMNSSFVDITIVLNEKRMKGVTNLMIILFIITFLVSMYLEMVL